MAHLAHEGFDPAFGARPLKRIIQREIGDPAAVLLLEGKVSDGDTITVDVVDGELVVNGLTAVAASDAAVIGRSSCTLATRSRRARTAAAAAWAGKPSWSARAMIDGAIRAQRRVVGAGDAVRLRNASTVMPDDTSAKPDVGSDAGQPITKLAALNGVCWPTRISPALTSPSTTASTSASRDGDLEVLGRVAVGDRDRLVEVVDEHAAAVRPERGPRRVGPHGRQVGELAGAARRRWRRRARPTSSRARPTSRCRARPRSAGRRPAGPGRPSPSAITRLSVGPSSIIVADAVALQLDLGARHRRRARADDLADPGDRLRAERRARPARPGR